MSVITTPISFVARNLGFIGRTVLYLGVIAVADTVFNKLIVKN